MEKEITYKGKKYKAEIKWGGNYYCVNIGTGYKPIPMQALTDLQLFKDVVIKAIEYKGDLSAIADWDGNLDKEGEN